MSDKPTPEERIAEAIAAGALNVKGEQQSRRRLWESVVRPGLVDPNAPKVIIEGDGHGKLGPSYDAITRAHNERLARSVDGSYEGRRGEIGLNADHIHKAMRESLTPARCMTIDPSWFADDDPEHAIDEGTLDEIADWLDGPLRLERAKCSRFHQVVEELQFNTNFTKFMPKRGDFGTVEVFVLQHDWAAAFEKATNFAEGEYRIAYDSLVLELVISGRPVCAYVSSDDGRPEMAVLFLSTKRGWVHTASYLYRSGAWATAVGDDPSVVWAVKQFAPVMKMVGDQLRAICITLEAEVTVSEVVRAPHKLNAAREKKGKLPLYDYHEISLASRRRVLPRAPEDGEPEAKRKSPRLHLRRGHYRHFETYKTWIKWVLAGDPDLGFVDKNYRL